METYSFLMSVKTDYRGPDESYAGVASGYLTYADPSVSESNLLFNEVASTVPIHDHRDWDSWNPILKQNTSHHGHSPPPETTQSSYLFTTRQEWVDSKTGEGLEPALNNPVEGDKSMSYAWTLNGQRLMLPSTPLLLQSYLSQQRIHDDLIIRLNIGDVVDITIQNSVAGNGVCESHPWHIHGNTGWVIGEGSGAFDPAVDPSNYNLIDPPYVDTVTNFPSAHGARRYDTFSNGTWQTPCGWFTMRIEVSQPGK